MDLVRKMQRRYRRGFLALATMTGIACAQVGGCQNTEVTTTVLGGLESLATTIVQAFFIAITPTDTTTTPVTTWLMDSVQMLLA